ncbi:hypothetical protein [Streptomyces sp. NPDC059071]|uniref:hypothetical protein n=1 Tax=unclassified Streptomyces TaxID=2593676 RepID=UPI003669FBCF
MPQHGEHDPTNGRFEEELGAVLRRTGEGFALDDRRELVNGGLVRGRRRLVRRRVAAVGGALALAMIGVGGVYGGSLLGPAGGAEQVSVAGPKPLPRQRDMAQIPVADLAAVLKAATPAGEWQIDNPDGTGQSVLGVYDDGKGKAAVSVGLYRAGTTQESGLGQVTCPDEDAVPYDDCTSERIPGGGRLMVIQGYEYPDKRVETKNWRAVLLTADGFLIDASEYNAPSEKGSAISRENPPFDPAQLKALVTAEGWRTLLKQIPAPKPLKSAPGASSGATAPEDDGPDVVETLRSLLSPRPGMKIVEKGVDGSGYGYVVLDDGKGRSLLQVNVQPQMDDMRLQHFSGGDVTFAADGTRVKLTKQVGEKGGSGVVWWSADTLAEDGLRVVVSCFNTGDQHKAATREEPALTTQQLKDIALSPRWRESSTR